MRRLVAVLGAAALSLPLAACGNGESRPSEAQAEALLADFFDLAQSRDATRFCGHDQVFSAEMCQNHWEWAGGPEAVPSEPPRVLGNRKDDDLLALRVCGTDGLGRPYQGDFVVEHLDDDLAVPLPVFWEGVDYSGTYEEGEEPTAEARETPKERIGCP